MYPIRALLYSIAGYEMGTVDIISEDISKGILFGNVALAINDADLAKIDPRSSYIDYMLSLFTQIYKLCYLDKTRTIYINLKLNYNAGSRFMLNHKTHTIKDNSRLKTNLFITGVNMEYADNLEVFSELYKWQSTKEILNDRAI